MGDHEKVARTGGGSERIAPRGRGEIAGNRLGSQWIQRLEDLGTDITGDDGRASLEQQLDLSLIHICYVTGATINVSGGQLMY